METPDELLLHVVGALEGLGIAYAVGGSVAGRTVLFSPPEELTLKKLE